MFKGSPQALLENDDAPRNNPIVIGLAEIVDLACRHSSDFEVRHRAGFRSGAAAEPAPCVLHVRPTSANDWPLAARARRIWSRALGPVPCNR